MVALHSIAMDTNYTSEFDGKYSSTASLESFDNLDNFDKLNTIFMSILILIIFFTSLVGNGLVCLVFYKRPNLLSISDRFIINLTVCNLISTIFVMPFVFVTIIAKNWIFKDIWCQATGFMMNTIIAASTLTLVVISFDRYAAVVTPLHYTMRVTSKRATLMIGGVWVVAVTSAIPPLFGWDQYAYLHGNIVCTFLSQCKNTLERYYALCMVMLYFVLPLIVLLWVYIVIFRAARTSSERVRRNSIVQNNDEVTPTPARLNRRHSSTAPILGRKISTASRTSTLLWHRDEWKAAVASLLIVSTFVVCYLPYFIVIILETLLDMKTSLHPMLHTVTIFLVLSSCAINPLVYVFRSKVIRDELKCILHGRNGQGQNWQSVLTRVGANMASSNLRNSSCPTQDGSKPRRVSLAPCDLASLVIISNNSSVSLA